jgi:hypothetical protein
MSGFNGRQSLRLIQLISEATRMAGQSSLLAEHLVECAFIRPGPIRPALPVGLSHTVGNEELHRNKMERRSPCSDICEFGR